MTLNTHAPYDDYVFFQGFDGKELDIEEASETCKNFKLQYQFFNALSKIRDNPKLKGMEVYVVGDHSPSIFNIKNNLFSFKGTDVAWIHFKIKD